jgi:MmyB-like transcription regulator ligand binding domain
LSEEQKRDIFYNNAARFLRLSEPVTFLHERSAEFAAWWEEQLVQLPRDGTKYYDHPEAGRLSFDYTVLDVADERFASLHLVSYLPTPGTTGGSSDRPRRTRRESSSSSTPARG